MFGLAGAIPAAASVQQSAATATSLVLDKVTVVDVEQGKLVPNQRVIITGNRIQAVGDVGRVKVPQGAQVVEAQGKYLIPGLWDLHVHPQDKAHVAYPLFVANGVTGIRDAGSPVPLDTLRLWRQEILAGTRVGPPRQILSGRALLYNSLCRSRFGISATTMCVFDSTDARHLVDSLKAAGADMIKPRSLRQDFDFVIAAEARRLGILFGGHAEEVPPIQASDSGISIIDHMQYDMKQKNGISTLCWAGDSSASVERCRPVAERFKKNGTWLAPTLFVYRGGGEHFGGGARAGAIAKGFHGRVQALLSNSVHDGNWLRGAAGDSDAGNASPSKSAADALGSMSIMQRVGLPILAATDAFRDPKLWGFALHGELAMFVAEGLTPLEALRSATLNPAKMLRGTDSLGTVAPGKLADLVLLNADPLADITNTTAIRAVIANGRYFDRAALDKLLVEAGREP